MKEAKLDTLTKVAESGKLSLPAQMRRQVGLEHGGPVLVRVENGEIRIRTVRDAIADLQHRTRRLFAGSGDSVDRFLADRRTEAKREGDAG